MPTFASVNGNAPLYYVAITITNSQSTATPAPFQQQITINSNNYSSYLASNLQNVNFQDGNGNIIPSWLESGNSNTSTSTIYWISLANGIGAGSSVTIYYCIYATSVNCFNTTNTGVAPQLTSTYGQYDNGANVFSLYSNFYDTLAGYSAHTNAGSYTPAPSTSPYNCVELMNNAGSSGAYILSPNNINPGNYILQTYWSYSGSADGFSASLWGNPNTIYGGGGGYSPGMSGGLTYHYEFYTGGSGTPPSGNPNEASVFSLTGNATGTFITSASASGEGTYYVYSQIAFYNIGSNSGTVAIYSSSATSTSIANSIEPAGLYNSAYQASASFSSISLSASPILFGAGTGGASAYVYIYWALMRAYPPNGTMPSISLGSLTPTTIVVPTITYSSEGETYSIPTLIKQPINYSEAETEKQILTTLTAGSLLQTLKYSESETETLKPQSIFQTINYKQRENYNMQTEVEAKFIYDNNETEKERLSLLGIPPIKYNNTSLYSILYNNTLSDSKGNFINNLYMHIPFNQTLYPKQINYNLTSSYLPPETNVSTVYASDIIPINLNFTFNISLSANTSTYVVTATVTDSAGNAIPNVVVNFSASGGTVSPTSATTNSSGQCTTTASGANVTVTASATLLGVTITSSSVTT